MTMNIRMTDQMRYVISLSLNNYTAKLQDSQTLTTLQRCVNDWRAIATSPVKKSFEYLRTNELRRHQGKRGSAG